MQNFMKTIVSAMKTWTKKEIKENAADWNQNDPSAANYVKNRPFYEKEGIVYKLDEKYLPDEYVTLEQFEQAVEGIQVAVEQAQDAAEQAQDTAETAKSTVDSKVDKTNPSCIGSFSMNRKNDTVIGNFSHTEGHLVEASGEASHAEGAETTASGFGSHAEGVKTTASKNSAHAEGNRTTASGDSSHAEGEFTTASGLSSHAEGEYTTAWGMWSHAEGVYTTASGLSSHAEGNRTTASGLSSHAEGVETTARRYCSHAEGYNTEAGSAYQHVQGKYNVIEKVADDIQQGLYAHIVGNGTSTKRSNAHTLDWDGNAWYQGEVYVGGTSQKDENAVKLAKVTDIPEAIEQWMTENPGQGGEVEIPETLPNPNKLTFTGAVTAEYDGSQPVEVEIPEIPEIPESIPIPETAEVGQTIVVKAVDENNKPTEWEAADLPDSIARHPDWNQNDETAPDYIKNKPEIATDDDAMDLLAELQVVNPVATSDGSVLTSSTGEIYIL